MSLACLRCRAASPSSSHTSRTAAADSLGFRIAPPSPQIGAPARPGALIVAIRTSVAIGLLILAGAVNAAASASRCLFVAPKVASAIASGLTARGGSIRGVQAVRSHDFKRIYFVAADIQEPGLMGKDEIAIWATNRIASYGAIWSVDRLALAFTDWANGPQTDAQFSILDDGAAAAEACTRSILKPSAK